MTTPHDEPTPETDILTFWHHYEGQNDGPVEVVHVNHARNLERDRNRLRAQLAGVRERCAKVSDDEEVPTVGGMPPQLIAAVLAQDTAAVERAIIAAVIATKKNISRNIRALSTEASPPAPVAQSEDAALLRAAALCRGVAGKAHAQMIDSRPASAKAKTFLDMEAGALACIAVLDAARAGKREQEPGGKT